MEKLNWKPVKILLGEVKAWAGNPRASTKAQARRIINSERKFGQPLPFLVEPKNDNGMYPLLDGHQRLAAWMTVYGADYVVDAMVCNRNLTDEEHRALVLALHAGAVGEWDWDRLSAWQPAELMEGGFDSDLLKQWKRDTSALDNFLGSEKAEQTPEFREYDESIADGIKVCECQTCGHKHAKKSN